MKRLLFLALFLLAKQINAQISEFAPIGGKWWYSFTWNGIDFEPKYYYIESMNNTILFGQDCKHLESSILYEFSQEKVADIYIYQNGDTIFYAIDSLEGERIDTTFNVLYNFNAEVGDSWDIHIGDYTGIDHILCSDDPDDYVIIDSTNFELIEGLNLKKISYHTESVTSNWGFDGNAYELLGNTIFMLPLSYGCFVKDPFPGYLNCYEDPNVGTLHFSPFGCANFDETINVQKDSGIYPNPFHDYFTIQNFANILQISIYTIDGTEITSFVKPLSSTIPLEIPIEGLLIIKVTYENNETYFYNLMKL